MSNDERFRERLLDASTWEETASQLLQAADLIEPKAREFLTRLNSDEIWGDSWRVRADEFVAIYFMLSAFAIENILKARIIRLNLERFRTEAEGTSRLPTDLKSHTLSNLAVRAGKAGLASGYADILGRLTRSATWYGRYPVPIAAQGLETQMESPDGEPFSLSAYSSSDIDEIERVLAELRPPHSP